MKINFEKNLSGVGPGTRAGSGSIGCSYYRKSTVRLYWGSQVSDLIYQTDASNVTTSSNSPIMTIRLFNDAVDKSSTGLSFYTLFSVNMRSAFWYDFYCDIDIDEASGTLFFAVKNYGLLRIDLSAASPPQAWAALPSPSTLYGFALDRRGAPAAPQVRGLEPFRCAAGHVSDSS